MSRFDGHADPQLRAMVDALREMLGLEPLYARSGDSKKSVRQLETERFATRIHGWPGESAWGGARRPYQ